MGLLQAPISTCFVDIDVKTKSGLSDVLAMCSGNCLPKSTLNCQSQAEASSPVEALSSECHLSPALMKGLCLA